MDRKNRKTSAAGARLTDSIKRKYPVSNYMAEFARALVEYMDGTTFKSIESALSAMISSDPSNTKTWKKKYFVPIERVLTDVRMADIIFYQGPKPTPRKGLYEVGTSGKYRDFQELAMQTDGSVSVLESYDEWSKGITNYVCDAENLEGLRYLFDNRFFDVFSPGKFSVRCYIGDNDQENQVLAILKIIAKDTDPDFKLFRGIFDPFSRVRLVTPDKGMLSNERIIKFILENDRLLSAVCHKPVFINESILNGDSRIVEEGHEFEGLCASNWLTPCLCYALNHEDRYLRQANRLLDFSLEIAQQTSLYIGRNLQNLDRDGKSISVKNGYVYLGHSHVIGIIGEPSTKGTIKNSVLKEKANAVVAKIGVFCGYSSLSRPQILDGKAHFPRYDSNSTYRIFVQKAQGHPYLFQLAKEKGCDSNRFVFDAPKGKTVSTLSAKQWKQLGKILRSIHSIDTGEEGKAYCHGRFAYDGIYVLPNGDIELLGEYQNVYVGNPEDDVMWMCFLAFHYSPYEIEPQEEISAFLSGYDYPKEGILEKLFDFLIVQSKKAVYDNDFGWYMVSANMILKQLKAEKKSPVLE